MSTVAATSILTNTGPLATATGRRLPVDPLAIRVGERVVLHGIDWPTYVSISNAAGARRLRSAFDKGVMELMPISLPHGRYAALLARMIATLSEELGFPLLNCGTFMINREDLAKGIEPDQCFYIEHAARIRPAEPIDLTRDPPPDLALEVGITSSSVDRLGIFESVGIPEVWRFDGAKFECRRRGPGGKYRIVETSVCIPGLRPNALLPFVEKSRITADDTALIQDFRICVREHCMAKSSGAESGSP